MSDLAALLSCVPCFCSSVWAFGYHSASELGLRTLLRLNHSANPARQFLFALPRTRLISKEVYSSVKAS